MTERDSAFARVMLCDMVDEDSVHSKHDLHVESADPIEVGTAHQAMHIPICDKGNYRGRDVSECLFDPAKIDEQELKQYLVWISQVWPRHQFKYREEIALQFLHEVLRYSLLGFWQWESMLVHQ